MRQGRELVTNNNWIEVFVSAVPIGRWRAEADLVFVQSRAVPDLEQIVRHGGAPEEVARSLLDEMT